MKDRIVFWLTITALVILFFVGLNMPADYEEPVPQPQVTQEQLDAVNVRLDAVERQQTEVSRGAVERPRGVIMEATAYCSCAICCDTATGITASGTRASEITAAADWDVLPAGTWVYIEGIGRRQVQDKGTAIEGNRLDVWFSSHEAALNFGRRPVEVIVE